MATIILIVDLMQSTYIILPKVNRIESKFVCDLLMHFAFIERCIHTTLLYLPLYVRLYSHLMCNGTMKPASVETIAPCV